MKKHYCYFDEEGNEAKCAGGITCDLCSNDCSAESFLMDEEVPKFPVLSSVCGMCLGTQMRNTDACHWKVDLCPACYEEKGSKYKLARRCVDGLEVGTPTSTQKASNVGKKKATGERSSGA